MNGGSSVVGFHRELLDLLRELHARAGSPAYRPIAEAARVSLGTVSNIFTARALPTPPVARAVARALRGSPAEQDRAFEYAQRAEVDRGKRPVATGPAPDCVFLDRFVNRGGRRDLSESTNQVEVWLRATGQRTVFVTGVRVRHVPGPACSVGSGAMPRDAQYSFTFASGQGPTELLLEPALVINPQDREVVRFELLLTPVGYFSTVGGTLYATVLYHVEGGEPGELPLLRPPAPWLLLARLTGKPLPMRLPNTNGVIELQPTGALRGSAPAPAFGPRVYEPLRDAADWGRTAQRDEFDEAWLVHREFLPALRESVADPDPELAKWAIWAMGEMRDADGLDVVLRSVRTDDAPNLGEALAAVEKIGSRAAVPPVIQLLTEHPKDWARQRAARTLGRLRDCRATGPLLDALVRENTRTARHGWNRVTFHWGSRVEKYIVEYGGWDLPVISRSDGPCMVGDGQATGIDATDLTAAEALVAIGDPAVLPKVLELALHPDERVRTAAAVVLDGLTAPASESA